MKDKWHYAAFIVLAAVFVFTSIDAVSKPQLGDENVYFYMGKLVADGKLPYLDFFLAHPPIHVYMLAALYKVFGFSLIAYKTFSLSLYLFSAFFLFLIASARFGKKEAILASAMFLFSYNVLFDSVFSFGIELALFFFTLGLFFLLNRHNYILAGILFSIASFTRLFFLIPIIILLLLLINDRKKFMGLIVVFLSVFVSLNLLFVALFAGQFLIPVYKYHFLKSADIGEKFTEYWNVIKLNWILFGSFLLFLMSRKKAKLSIFFLSIIVFLIFLLLIGRVYAFYFITIFPLIALVGAVSIADLIERFQSRAHKVLIFSLICAILLWDISANIKFLNNLGHVGYSRAKDVSDFISQKDEKFLFGDESATPLISLITEKQIVFGFADTNPQVFTSGIKDISKLYEELGKTDFLFIIRDNQGISQLKETQDFINTRCDFLTQFNDKIEGNILIFSC